MSSIFAVNLTRIAPFADTHENWMMPDSYNVNLDTPYYRQCVADTDGILYTAHWRNMESEFGVYNFTTILNALNYAAVNGKKMIVRLFYKTYSSAQAKPLPNYILNDPLVYGGSTTEGGLRMNHFNGWTPRFDNRNVMDRFKALITAMSVEIGSHPTLQGVAPDESAWSFGGLWGTSTTTGLTGAQVRQAHREKCLHFQSCFPGKEVYPFYNYCDGSTNVQIVGELQWSLAQGMCAGITDTHRVPEMLLGVQPVYISYPTAAKTLMCVDYLSSGSEDSGLVERYLENARRTAELGTDITAWYTRGGASSNYWAAVRSAIAAIG
jgi:hypothetical protein